MAWRQPGDNPSSESNQIVVLSLHVFLCEYLNFQLYEIYLIWFISYLFDY